MISDICCLPVHCKMLIVLVEQFYRPIMQKFIINCSSHVC